MARARPTSYQDADINEIINETLPMVRKVLKDGKVRVALNLADGLPALRGDIIQIQQVLINLILNARDAMAPSGGQLTITTEPWAEDKPGVMVSVRDTGVGMTTEELKKIFSPFYSTKLDKGGTGLGLTICQRIMRQHEGQITVQSIPLQSTTFNLWFPVK
jgi:signal transduction histidine kinase